MTAPGWYPDPTGDYVSRFFDGSTWTAHVANGPYQAEDPPVDPTPSPSEVLVWESGQNRLTTHRIWINDGTRGSDITELQLWMVGDVEVTANLGQHLTSTGRVAVKVEYPGYAGRSHFVMNGISEAHSVGALIRKWANRNRRQYLGDPSFHQAPPGYGYGQQ